MSTHAASAPFGGDRATLENRKVPLRRANVSYRSREYLSDREVAALMAAAAGVGRHGARDAALILIAYRRGLRVSELVSPALGPGRPAEGATARHAAQGMASPRSTPCAAGTARLAPAAAGLPGHRPTYS